MICYFKNWKYCYSHFWRFLSQSEIQQFCPPVILPSWDSHIFWLFLIQISYKSFKNLTQMKHFSRNMLCQMSCRSNSRGKLQLISLCLKNHLWNGITFSSSDKCMYYGSSYVKKFFRCVQGPKKWFAKCDKHYPSRSGQTSLATAVANFTKPRTSHFFDLCTAVLSEAWAKLCVWASVADRGRPLLSGSVAHASLETAVD